MSLTRTISFGILFALASGACDPPPVVAPGTTASGAASVDKLARPQPPGAPVDGSRIAVFGGALVVADGDHVARMPLPFGSGDVSRHAMGGEVGALVALGDELLVTVRDPGAIVLLTSDGLTERKRIAVPEGADAVAVHAGVAYVTAPKGKLLAIDLAKQQTAWSVDVKAPRGIALSAAGDVAVVTHAVGATRVALASRKAEPILPKALDPVAARSGEGIAVAYGVLPASLEPRAQQAKVTGGAVDDSKQIPAHARALRAHGDQLYTATSTMVVDKPHACADPRGLALSPDAAHAYLACGDGRVAQVPLGDGEPTYHSLTPSPVVSVDCSKVKKGPVAPEHREKLGNADRIHDWLRRYHCNHRDLTDLIEIGKSHLGRPILALVVGNAPRLGHAKPTFFINGAHHGSELMSSMFALDAIDQLLEAKHPAVPRFLREDVVFVVVPLVNPDGNMAYLKDKLLGRKNGRDTDEDGTRGHTDGVDLNRNYPFRWHSLGENGSSSKIHSRYYRGPSPGSEPETRAVMRLAESERFAGSISFHTGTLAILAPYTIPKVKNPSPNEAWTVAEHIAKQITGHPEGFVPVKKNLYAVDGTDQDWLRNEHGTVALLVEGADNWLVDVKTRKKMVFWIRKSWVLLVDRYLDGAAVGGHVYDAVMRPIEADVSFDEIYRPEKESWTSRCRDGRFDRYLSKGGSYTLNVKLGEHAAKKKVEVSARKRAKTDVVLPLLVTERAQCPTIWSTQAKPAKVIGVTPTP